MERDFKGRGSFYPVKIEKEEEYNTKNEINKSGFERREEEEEAHLDGGSGRCRC